MADCAALGDSLAVGLAAASGCQRLARVGVTSPRFAASFAGVRVPGAAVISLGANDRGLPVRLTAGALAAVRSQVQAATVVWLLPPNASAERAAAVRAAARPRDYVLSIDGEAAAGDGLHPTAAGYREIWRRVRDIGHQAGFVYD